MGWTVLLARDDATVLLPTGEMGVLTGVVSTDIDISSGGGAGMSMTASEMAASVASDDSGVATSEAVLCQIAYIRTFLAGHHFIRAIFWKKIFFLNGIYSKIIFRSDVVLASHQNSSIQAKKVG